MKHIVKYIWKLISGTDEDFTEVRLSKAILLLSIPMVLEMVMESIFAIVDIIFVQKLGSQAIAIVGITESLLTITYSIAWGLSMSATSIVSRRIGEKNKEEASKSAFQAIMAGSMVSIGIALVGIFGARHLLQLMGSTPEMIEMGWKYPTILLTSNIVIMLLFVNNAIFRSSGDAVIAFVVLLIANILNLILDPCFIFGLGPFPKLGITGAAVATTTGRGIAVILQFVLLFSGNFRIKLSKRHIKIDWKLIGHIFKVSLGGIGQNIIATASWIFLMRIISGFGSVVVAGYTVAIRILIFALLPSWGLSNAASTLVGQNLGAQKPERAEKAVWATAIVNMIVQGLIGLSFILFPAFFVKLIAQQADVIPFASEALQKVSFGMLFFGVGMVMVQAFNGAGDTNTPTLINIFCFWILEIPLALLLTYSLNLGESGVYYSIVIAESCIALVGFILFKKGNWKLKKV